jgi:hypothetical protein
LPSIVDKTWLSFNNFIAELKSLLWMIL